MKERLNSIEFFRVFFILCVIVGHCIERYYTPFKYGLTNTRFCCELFFMISGFFLYRKIASDDRESCFRVAKKMYARLVPAYFFLVFLCLCFGLMKTTRLPTVFTLTSGLSLSYEAVGWGDWFIGTYFWSLLFFVGILSYFRKCSVWLTCLIIYIAFSLKMHTPYPGWGTHLHFFIGSEFVRGIYSVGMGILFGYFNEVVHFPKTKKVRFLFSVGEIYCIVSLLKYILNTSSQTFLELETMFGFLLISASCSQGVICSALNKCSLGGVLSKYCYSVFMMHCFPLLFLMKRTDLGLTPFQSCLFILFGAVVLGVFSYHMIERRFFPYMFNLLKKGEVK